MALVALLVGCSGNGNPGLPDTPSAREQMRFGVSMAQRGLWREALFRFQQAERLAGEDAEVLANVAVALEGVGDFEQALAYYKRALALEPANRDLKRNYARFIEFYQSFRPGAARAAAGAATPTAPPVPAAAPPAGQPAVGQPPTDGGGAGRAPADR